MRKILYYTDNSLDETVLGKAVKDRLQGIADNSDLQILSVSQKPIDFGQNVCVGEKPACHVSMLEQIIAGLKAAEAQDFIFLTEHDCLYHESHYHTFPWNRHTFNYNSNFYRCTSRGYSDNSKNKMLLSMCSGWRPLMFNYFRVLLRELKALERLQYPNLEPGRNDASNVSVATYESLMPCIDIRHGGCLTQQTNMNVTHQTVGHWGDCAKLRQEMGITGDQAGA